MPKATKMQELVVLGLLNEKPRYGYEIKMIIDNVMSHVIDVSSGSLYYALKKLREQGLVKETAVEKVGRRPERSIYEITELGQKAFSEDLPELIFPQARPFFPLDLALYFLPFVDPREQLRRVRLRLAYIALMIEYSSEIEDRFSSSAPPHHMMVLMHQRHYMFMERDYLTGLCQELEKHVSYDLSAADMQEVALAAKNYKARVRYEVVTNPEQ
ncbi:PadR family transcriptional regulator [bacterium]|nr:PadR family transcriptional regulator [bacterium]